VMPLPRSSGWAILGCVGGRVPQGGRLSRTR
jgi:hypothetical protein